MENINTIKKVVQVNPICGIEVSELCGLSAAGSWAATVAEPVLGDGREDVSKDWFAAEGVSAAAEVGAA